MWEACFEPAGDDIGESVTQEVLGDYVVPVGIDNLTADIGLSVVFQVA